MSAPLLDKTVQAQLMTSDGWRFRRTLLFTVTWFLCGLVGFLAYTNTGTPIAVMLIPYCFTAIMTFVMAYVFAAVWDDAKKRSYAVSLGTPQTGDSASSANDTPTPPTPAQ